MCVRQPPTLHHAQRGASANLGDPAAARDCCVGQESACQAAGASIERVTFCLATFTGGVVFVIQKHYPPSQDFNHKHQTARMCPWLTFAQVSKARRFAATDRRVFMSDHVVGLDIHIPSEWDREFAGELGLVACGVDDHGYQAT